MGGVATHLVEKNTTIPTARTQTFSTAADNQTSVEVHVVQGERPMASDNKSLGRFILDGIPPAPRGIPQVEVTFDVDANGILNVSAKEKTTGKTQSIRIEASSGLSKDEVEKMKKEAEMHSDEDKKKKDLIEVKNLAEQTVYTSEKALRENGDKITAEIKTTVEEKISELKKVKDGTDMDAIKKATEALSLEMQKIGEHMAKNQQTTGQEKPKESGEKKDENVRDAEFKEGEDKEKK